MVFNDFCILELWAKVGSALEGSNSIFTLKVERVSGSAIINCTDSGRGLLVRFLTSYTTVFFLNR